MPYQPRCPRSHRRRGREHPRPRDAAARHLRHARCAAPLGVGRLHRAGVRAQPPGDRVRHPRPRPGPAGHAVRPADPRAPHRLQPAAGGERSDGAAEHPRDAPHPRPVAHPGRRGGRRQQRARHAEHDLLGGPRSAVPRGSADVEPPALPVRNRERIPQGTLTTSSYRARDEEARGLAPSARLRRSGLCRAAADPRAARLVARLLAGREHVAFTEVNGQGRLFTLKVVDTATKRVRTLGQSSSQLFPSWSADSKTIAYQSGGRIWTVGVDGTGKRALYPGLFPAFSPQGAKIAYRYDFSLYIDGVKFAGDSVIGMPIWAPDGNSMVYTRTDGIYLLSAGSRIGDHGGHSMRCSGWSGRPTARSWRTRCGGTSMSWRRRAGRSPQRIAGPFADIGPLAWAPTSDQLAYTVRRRGRALDERADLALGAVRQGRRGWHVVRTGEPALRPSCLFGAEPPVPGPRCDPAVREPAAGRQLRDRRHSRHRHDPRHERGRRPDRCGRGERHDSRQERPQGHRELRPGPRHRLGRSHRQACRLRDHPPLT